MLISAHLPRYRPNRIRKYNGHGDIWMLKLCHNSILWQLQNIIICPNFFQLYVVISKAEKEYADRNDSITP
jgi:hypothetical protein